MIPSYFIKKICRLAYVNKYDPTPLPDAFSLIYRGIYGKLSLIVNKIRFFSPFDA